MTKTKRITWTIEKRKLADLKEHANNPRQFTEKGMKDLENSINSIGFMQPININQDGTILSGHARTKKLKEMGEIEVDVYVPDRVLTPKQEEEVLVRANANTAGQWDFDILANNFDLEEITDWGLDVPDMDLDIEEEAEVEEDEVPELKHKFAVKGDLFELIDEEQGLTHRVLCGDSTMIDDVEKVMNGEKADMVFTDPPYGINVVKNRTIGGGNYTKAGCYNPIIGDDKDYDPSFILNYFECKKIIWGANYFSSKLPNSKSWIVWHKYESQTNFSDGELAWSDCDKPLRVYKHIWAGSFREGKKDIELKKRVHPTQKPATLFVNIFDDFANDCNIIWDGFLGSGSTLIACQQTKRNCYGIELDEHYCGVIVKRWLNYMQKEIKPFKIKRNDEDFDIKEIKE